jgi:hypothetical protein
MHDFGTIHATRQMKSRYHDALDTAWASIEVARGFVSLVPVVPLPDDVKSFWGNLSGLAHGHP